MPNIWYTIKRANGALIHGETDSQGRTDRVSTKSAEDLQFFIGHIEEVS
jgi:uncharacterized protein (DUF2345 family)